MPKNSLCWLRTGRRAWNNSVDIPEAPRIAGNLSWQLLQFCLQWRKSGDFQNMLGLTSNWICGLETAIMTWPIVGWKPVSNMWFGVRCGWRKCSGQGVLSVSNRPQRSKDEHNTDLLFHLQCLLCCWEVQRQITFPHPKAPSQGVSHWMEQTWGVKLNTAFSESWNLFFQLWLWLWIQKPKEAKLCLAIQSIYFAFKCLTPFCTRRNSWSQKVWDKFRAEIRPGYISVKKGFGLRRKQNLRGQKRYGAMHATSQGQT